MLKLYTIVDKVAHVSTNPMVFANDEDAKRYYETVAMREGSIIGARPNDFDFVCCGDFDRETGKVVSK